MVGRTQVYLLLLLDVFLQYLVFLECRLNYLFFFLADCRFALDNVLEHIALQLLQSGARQFATIDIDMIPKSKLNADINGTIFVQASCQTYPVFYGKTRIAKTQDYAITYDSYEMGWGLYGEHIDDYGNPFEREQEPEDLIRNRIGVCEGYAKQKYHRNNQAAS